MKKILTIVCGLLAAVALQAQTSHQLRIYQKGGQTDTLRVDGSTTISHLRQATDGQAHDDAVTISIATADGNRLYPIETIDSLVLPNGRRVVFRGSMVNQPLLAPAIGGPRRTSFNGKFPGQGTDNVTFFWTDGDRIRLDIGAESRAESLSNSGRDALFTFNERDLESEEYIVFYPSNVVTIPTEQTQTGANNSNHIGENGDCGTATATRQSDGSYAFTLNHHASYLCFLPHIDHLPSAKVTKIELYSKDDNIAGTYNLSPAGLVNPSNESKIITLNCIPQNEGDFFIGHDRNTTQDTCAAYMVVKPLNYERTFYATYYITDTLSHYSTTYTKDFQLRPLANTVHPITCNIPDAEFRAVDLGLSANWRNTNVDADEPSQQGTYYADDNAANDALLAQTTITEWLMPTEAQRQELMERCTWEWGEYNGAKGYLITGHAASRSDGNVHRIFIPSPTGATMDKADLLDAVCRPVEALMVDLGLPNGTLWASRNIGANSAEESGDYYAWGESKTKLYYDANTYDYYNGSWRNLGDDFDISGTEYDVARTLWGGLWRMPTKDELEELAVNTTWTWETNFRGKQGYIVRSNQEGNNNCIFLPAAGSWKNGALSNQHVVAQYPSSTQRYYDYTDYCWTITCHTNWNYGKPILDHGSGWQHSYRAFGRVVRAVTTPTIATEGMLLDVRTDSAQWRLGDSEATLHATLSSGTPIDATLTVGFILGDTEDLTIDNRRFDYPQTMTEAGTFAQPHAPLYDNMGYWYRAYVKVGDTYYYGKALHYGAEMIDLGITDAQGDPVLWANMNIGASRPSDYGDYYAWGETETKQYYDSNTYDYYNGSWRNLGNDFDISGTEYDVAHVKLGNAWCMPSKAEWEALCTQCDWQYTSLDGVNGYRITSKSNGNSIFLPCAGSWKNGALSNQHVVAQYPSSTQRYYDYTSYCWTVTCHTNWNYGKPILDHGSGWQDSNRAFGRVVRAVAKPTLRTDDMLLEIRTDSAQWRLGDSEAILHATLNSTKALSGALTVGFIVGDSCNIDMDHKSQEYHTTVTASGPFTWAAAPVYENIGYWYRAYLKVGDTYYYGKALHYGLELVDMGLPSGKLWANMNVGAGSPEAFGNYYSWGETEPKANYKADHTEANYKLRQNGVYVERRASISGSDLDAATVNMGAIWRTPTADECQELVTNCNWESVTYHSVRCWKVTSRSNPNNYIYFPIAGRWNGSSFDDVNNGIYMTASSYSENQCGDFYQPYSGTPSSNMNGGNHNLKYKGMTVRAICDGKKATDDGTILNVRSLNEATPDYDHLTMRATLGASQPLAAPVTVGFLVSKHNHIEKGSSGTTAYATTTTATGLFSQTIEADRMNGFWYRPFVETADTIIYGEMQVYGYATVDLGLSTLWASTNVGGSHTEDIGNFYTWGEVEPKESYPSTTCLIIASISGTQYDAATHNMGELWQTPTQKECEELVANCTWLETTINGKACWKGTSKKEGYTDRYIILPKGGRWDGATYGELAHGLYMTATQVGTDRQNDFYLPANGTPQCSASGNTNYKYKGMTVRAVMHANIVTDDGRTLSLQTDNAIWNAGNTAITMKATVHNDMVDDAEIEYGFRLTDHVDATRATSTVHVPATTTSERAFSASYALSPSQGIYYTAYAKIAGTYYYASPRFAGNGVEMIDLGLPSGTLWANINVGATTVGEPGNYYAWGETYDKSDFTQATYQYYVDNRYTDIGADIQGTEYDVAHMRWGSEWVMPTISQINELINNCTFTSVTINGVSCYRLVSKLNGNVIYFPEGGVKGSGGAISNGTNKWAFYWTATRHDINHGKRTNFYYGTNLGTYYEPRYNGLLVRPVINKKATP